MKRRDIYKIQVIENIGYTHLRISRYDGKPIRCTWDVLQKMKNDAVGKDVTMVEVFPSEDRLVNEVNMRHFWSVEDGFLPFGLIPL